ncbi:MAG TPA: DUF4396 domain-containing protein [Candidatus Saccharimonadales bacterium]|nr:DUF4396 domain-containing protein [Candidatus Saccharimonadales bacterium]
MEASWKNAGTHTLHCLVGCGIGEILGSMLGSILVWPNAVQTAAAVILAFAFGYGITYAGARRSGLSSANARTLALSTDTISITSMEIIDNTLEWLIPGAMNAQVISWLFWWSMAVSLLVAFICTVPVNYQVLKRLPMAHSHH